MKTFLLLVLTVTALFVWQRQGNDGGQQQPQPPVPSTVATGPAEAPPSRTVSEHNWAKHSLDRTHAVADQVRQSRQPGE